MEVNKFGPGETSAVAETPNPSTAVAPPVQSALPAKRQGMVLGDILPSFDQVILPRVNISQNIGQLQDVFEPGSLVLNRQTLLFLPPDIDTTTGIARRAATAPVVVTALGFRPTRFVEKTTGGQKGIIVNTEQDVTAAGGTLDYGEWKLKAKTGMKRFEPLVDACVLIQRPEGTLKKADGTDAPLCPDDDTVFVHEIEGKKYAMALWALRGTCYTALAKGVWFTARMMGCLRGGYPTYSYNISTKEKAYDTGNRSWIPIAVPHSKNPPAFIEFVRGILEPPQG